MRRKLTIVLTTVAAAYLLLCGAVYFLQAKLLFPGASRHSAVHAPPNVRIRNLKTDRGTSFRLAVGSPTGQPKAALIHFVGNGEDLGSGVHRAATFANYGFEVFVPEYPGYGESEGAPGHDPILAAAEACAKQAKKWADEHKLPLLVSGQSLGTFSAMHVAAQGFGTRLLLTSPPTSIARAGQQRFWFLPVALLLKHPFDNLKDAAKVRIPTLVLHGDRDGIVPYAMGQEMANRLPNATLHTLPGRGHNNLEFDRHSDLGRVVFEHFVE